jgi:hypothetical protein
VKSGLTATRLAAAEHIGFQPESAYRYNVTNLEDQCQRKRPHFANEIFRPVFLKSERAIKQWMMTKGPVMASILFNAELYDIAGDNATRVYEDNNLEIVGGHAFTCSGWDWNFKSNKTGLHGAWICKNSWSTEWGDQGYFRIANGQFGVMAEAVGYELVSGDKTCKVGKQVTITNPDGEKEKLDACSAIRVGMEWSLMNWDMQYAKEAYGLAGSTKNQGIDGKVTCRVPFTQAQDPTEVSIMLLWRDAMKFFSGKGLMQPLSRFGCSVTA